jgi:hypothetical protein
LFIISRNIEDYFKKIYDTVLESCGGSSLNNPPPKVDIEDVPNLVIPS